MFPFQADEEEEEKEKIPLVKEEPRGRRQPQKQGSAIDLDIGPPLEPSQVRLGWKRCFVTQLLLFSYGTH